MSASNYNYCLTLLLKDEGGYSNNPSDPGGPTNFGITLADYKKYIDSKGTAKDVKNMTVEQAKAIYKPKYWDALGCDNLPSGVDYAVFDYGVNSGVGRAKRILQKFIGLKDPVKIVNAISDERLSFLHSLGTWSVFGKGWGPRVERVRQASIKLTKSPATVPGTAGAVVVAGGVAASQAPHHHWPYIIAGTAVALIIVLIGISIYRYRKSLAHAA